MIRDPMRVLTTVLGIILLLPGACAAFSAVVFRFDPSLAGLWLICFLVSALGVFILYRAYRRTDTDRPADP
jgi:drug/metabolite transporter (DMT)-like permease